MKRILPVLLILVACTSQETSKDPVSTQLDSLQLEVDTLLQIAKTINGVMPTDSASMYSLGSALWNFENFRLFQDSADKFFERYLQSNNPSDRRKWESLSQLSHESFKQYLISYKEWSKRREK